MKRLIALIILLTSTICSAQISYSGVDVAASLTAKLTMSNLALYSEQIDNAAWTKDTAKHVITANSIVAPDGTTTADLATLAVLAASAARYIYPTATITVSNATVYRQFAYMKAGTHGFIHYYSQAPSTAYIDVNLNTCTILRAGATNISSSVTSVGNGWCLVSFTYTTSSVNASPTFQPLKDATSIDSVTWTSAGTETYYIWGVGLNLASAPADYLLTTGTAATLGPLCGKGTSQSLLDPSRCFPMQVGGTPIIRSW